MSPRLPSPVQPLKHAADAVSGVRTIAATGLVRPVRPDRLARVLLAERRYGTGPAFSAAAAAALHPDRPAILDELGALSFGELDVDARALAGALATRFGLSAGQRVAIMCRNHRGFVHAAVAASRIGCDLVPLNTDFAGPQLAEVLRREVVVAAVYDEEFEPVFENAGFAGARVIAWHDPESASELARPTLAQLIALGAPAAPPPREPGRVILLTSGTTGTPKGANRSVTAAGVAALAVGGLIDLGRVKPAPKAGEPVVVCPPLFHLYGMIGLSLAFGLGAPIVIRRRFEPEGTLAQIAEHHAGMLLAVPTMLARIMAVPASRRRAHDTGSLRMIISGAAPLAPELATAVMDEFGDILFNGYASTEVGSVTLATPADLRAAPGTVGRAMATVTLRILDDRGAACPDGATGRIFVGSPLLFDGYTGGGGKEIVDGLMSTGDVGHLDRDGRLYVDGRDDDMIVSGGENVYPQEVEELLSSHAAVADAAVLGVPDPEFGQRLTALVVPADGAQPSEAELKDFVRAHLARFKVPREIQFVSELPRTSTGKLQRRKLPATGRTF